MITDYNKGPETMGVFGFSWQEKIAKNIGFPTTILNASSYGSIVNNMYKAFKKYRESATSEQDLINRIISDTQQKFNYVKKAIEQFRIKDDLGSGAVNVVVPENAKPISMVEAVTGFEDPLQAVSGINSKVALGALAAAALGYMLIKNPFKKKTK